MAVRGTQSGPRSRSAKDGSLRREVPPVVIGIVIAVVVLALGAGIFYAWNGGWKTASQQEEAYKHDFLPVMAAKHGDTEALDAENKRRQQQGQAPLVVPQGHRGAGGDVHQQLQRLQQQLGTRPGR